jgi:ElaB/YqjD/DUF883 family membrane-anchored ribosome-binding protein
MTDPSATANTAAFDHLDSEQAEADFHDALAREQLKEGAHEISDAAADAAGSVREAAIGSATDIVEAARELIRQRPLAALAGAAALAYLYARIRR